MTVYERICVRDWAIEAQNGDRQECKAGQRYTVSAPHEDGTVTVFSRFWVRAPRDIFLPPVPRDEDWISLVEQLAEAKRKIAKLEERLPGIDV